MTLGTVGASQRGSQGHILTASRKGDYRRTRMGAQTSWRLLQQEENCKDGGGERRAYREGSARGQTDGTWAIKEKTVPFPKMKRSSRNVGRAKFEVPSSS